MRIAIEATPAAAQSAGVGRYTRELIHALVSRPDADRFVLTSAAGQTENSALLDRLPPGQWREVRRIPMPERYLSIAWQRLRVPVAIERFIGEFDVFHGTDFVLPPSRRPRVVTIHDLSFLHAPQFAEPSLVRYLESAVPRSLKSATYVIAVSASVAAEIADVYPWVRERLVAIPSGVHIPPTVNRASHDRPTILIVGTIEPRKNVSALLRSMEIVHERLPDARLIVAGRVGWQSESIMQDILQAQRRGIVELVTSPDDTTLDRLYASATLVAYPSFYEGFGFPVLEAMARGVPVVVSDIPALRETAGDAALFADPHDPSSIAAAILGLLEHDDLRGIYAERGLARANCFSWAETAARTRRVYERAAEQGP